MGICVTGNFTKYRPSEEQYSSLRKLLDFLCFAFHIPKENILLHRDLANTVCPGKFFDLKKALYDLGKSGLAR
jgi:N-acetylmuramoyl-L-alanine amidase